jgi:hypothetical protein
MPVCELLHTPRPRARAEMSAFLVDDAIVGLAQPAPASQVRAWSSFEIRRVLICLMPWQNILRLRPAPEILADKLNNVGGLRPVACSICSRLNPFASTTDTATRSRHRAEDPRRSTGLGSIKSAKLIAPVSPRLRKKTPLGTDREMPPRAPSGVRWWRRDCVAGWEDSNSGIRAQAMYLRCRDNSRWVDCCDLHCVWAAHRVCVRLIYARPNCRCWTAGRATLSAECLSKASGWPFFKEQRHSPERSRIPRNTQRPWPHQRQLGFHRRSSTQRTAKAADALVMRRSTRSRLRSQRGGLECSGADARLAYRAARPVGLVGRCGARCRC